MFSDIHTSSPEQTFSEKASERIINVNSAWTLEPTVGNTVMTLCLFSIHRLQCWNYRCSFSNITSSSKQNRGCIGIEQLGNKISILITVCANIFRSGIAAHRKLCLRYLIQQSSKTSRSKATGSPWSPTRGGKMGCSGFWLLSAQSWYTKHSANISGLWHHIWPCLNNQVSHICYCSNLSYR